RYLKGWFTLDILSSLPVALFMTLKGSNSVSGYLMMIKLVRTLKLYQLSVITNKFLKKFEDKDLNPAVFRIYLFVVAFALVLHFIACGYWWISRDEGFGGYWTPEEEYLAAPLSQQYARAVYFAFVITYGNDLRPESMMEYTYSIFCLGLALLVNAVIIGSAANLLSNMDTTAIAKKSHMDGINGYMRFRKVPTHLQQKIRKYYEYLWDSGQDNRSLSLFDDMPEKLRIELNVALKKRLIEKV
ncbi:unnamed protein product, partial [Discosporangium mesarthrocarpum]